MNRSMREIAVEVAAARGLTLADLTGRRRRLWEVRPRHEAMALMYETGRFSTTQIGRFLGGRDHTTVVQGIRAHRARTT